MIWSGGNSFGHWLGVVCPDCGHRIPTHSNAISWVILKSLSLIYKFTRQPCGQAWSRWRSRFLAWEWGRAYRKRQQISSTRIREEDA